MANTTPQSHPAGGAVEEIAVETPIEPIEPGGLFLNVVVSEERAEAGADEDGDWFADIEGFESL